jgi:hypothetical protein
MAYWLASHRCSIGQTDAVPEACCFARGAFADAQIFICGGGLPLKFPNALPAMFTNGLIAARMAARKHVARSIHKGEYHCSSKRGWTWLICGFTQTKY